MIMLYWMFYYYHKLFCTYLFYYVFSVPSSPQAGSSQVSFFLQQKYHYYTLSL